MRAPCWFDACMYRSVAEFIDNETYKEVAIVEKSIVKQCVSCVGSVSK
jgi:hypothetical protein